MRNAVEIEEIDQMRRSAGIDDVELWEDIRALHVGDCVRLTFFASAKPSARETLSVRITSIQGDAFRGKLVSRPTGGGLTQLRIGTPVAFTGGQIHSVLKEQAGHAP